MVIVMVMVVHVLHRDPAPHADYKCLDFTLVVSTSDTEVAVLTPILSPGVGSNLKKAMDTVRSEIPPTGLR